MNAQMVAARVVGVDVEVAGTKAVPYFELEKKLGKCTMHVLQVLWGNRSRDGNTHITNRGIARARGFTPTATWTVKKAINRLQECGLVTCVGWLEARVRNGKKHVDRMVYVRSVYGANLLGGINLDSAFCAVPSQTANWLKAKTEKRGGYRVGSGRPRKVEPGNSAMIMGVDNCGAYVAPTPPATTYKPHLQTAVHTGGVYMKRIKNGPTPIIKNGPSVYSEGVNALRIGELFLKEKIPSGTEAAPTSSFLEEVQTANGVLLTGGAKRPARALSNPGKGLPPFPGISVVAPAIVPAPSLLDSNADAESVVRALAQAFRCAVEHEYGAPCFMMARGVAPANRKLLAECGMALRDYKIAPISWAVYAVRRWRNARMHTNDWKKGDPVPLPPVRVVFRVAAIEDQCAEDDRIATVRDTVRGGRTIYGPAHRMLLNRYTQMHAAINRGVPRDVALGKFFPGDAYADMVDAAKAEVVDERFRLERRMAAGKWVW